MEQQELIRANSITEIKRNLYGITVQGLRYAWNDQEPMQERPCFEPSKVKPLMVQHHLDIQIARLNAQQAAWQNWIPGRLLPKGTAKRPDAIVEKPDR